MSVAIVLSYLGVQDMKLFYTLSFRFTLTCILLGNLQTSFADSSSSSVALAPIQANQNYSLVRIFPDLRRQPETLSALKKWEPELSHVAADLNTSLLKALISPERIPETLVELSKSTQAKLSAAAIEMNRGLSETNETVFSIFVAPFKKIESASIISNVPVFQQLQVLEYNPNASQQTLQSANEAYQGIDQAIRSIKIDRYKNFQFTGLAVHLRLLKNNIRVDFQLIGFLKGGYEEFAKANDQVIINHFEVLTDPASGRNPMVMIQVHQKLKIHKYEQVEHPKISMNFGGFDGLIQSPSLEGVGSFSILGSQKNHQENCKLKYSLVPTLFGSFASKPTGKYFVDKFLHNKFVRFRILSLELDAQTFKISNLNVATGLDDYREYQLLNCLSLPVVGQAFTEEANASIEQSLKQLATQDTATQELMERIYE